MPICYKCGHMDATANMRKSPKGGYMCRDKTSCKADTKAKDAGKSPAQRTISKLLEL